jgi:hypothetical protein
MTDTSTRWQRCLAELRLQMAEPTFTEYLAYSAVASLDSDVLTIAVDRPVDWLQHRMGALIQRTVHTHFSPTTTVRFLQQSRAKSPAAQSPTPVAESPVPAVDPDTLRAVRAFNPNTAESGGFSMIGNYANTFWAAYLGTVPWRIYTLVYADDKRKNKTDWTRPVSYTISGLARAIPCSRNAIRGRWRAADDGAAKGARSWRPGAFDALTLAGVAQIQYHDHNPLWRPWRPGGFRLGDASGQRIIYRLAVLTALPLLSPLQVAQLPADLRRDHDRYLATRDVDLLVWESITLPTLAPGRNSVTGAQAPVTGALTPLTGVRTPVNDPFFTHPSATGELE